MLALKLLVLAAIIWGVSGTLKQAWADLDNYSWTVSWPWLVACGVIYLSCMVPSIWFWRKTMQALGGSPQWLETAHAYMLGHLAKYAPGKGLVVAVRAGAMSRQRIAVWPAVVSIFVETLAMMAAGALLATVLAWKFLDLDNKYMAAAIGMIFAVGIPTLPPVVRFGMRIMASLKFAKRTRSDDNTSQDSRPQQNSTRPNGGGSGVTFGLVTQGWLVGGAVWILQGLSLWALLRGIGVDGITNVESMLGLIAALALATVAGFLSMLPAGFGVRDVLVVELLTPLAGEAPALIAAVLLRIIWLVAEVVAFGILAIMKKRSASSGQQSANALPES